MGTLTNQQIDQTYDGLIKTNDEQPISGTLKGLQDGLGNDLPMQVSTTDIKFTGNADFTSATVTGIPDDNTTYDFGAVGAAGNISMAMSGSDATNDVVVMQAGTNITLTDNGSNTFTIDASGGAAGLVDDGNDSIYSDLTSQPASVTNNGTNAIAIGRNAHINGGNGGIAIGHNTTGGEGTVVIGKDAQEGDIYGTAVGGNARGGYFGAALGNGAQNNSNFSVAVGGDARTETDNGIAIGYGAQSRASHNIVIGTNALVDDAIRVNTVVIGSDGANQTKAAQYSNVVGASSFAVGANSNTFGYNSNAYHNYSVVLGSGLQSAADYFATVQRLHLYDWATSNFGDDAVAAANGWPLGGVYHTDGVLKIRIV